MDRDFNLALMIGCDFCALSPEQRQNVIRKVRGMPEPGGAFLVDVTSFAGLAGKQESVSSGPGLMDGFWSPEPYFGLRDSVK